MSEDVLHFDRKTWKCELRLRGKPIEFMEGTIRCAAMWEEFPALPGTDLIIFAGHNFQLQNYIAWYAYLVSSCSLLLLPLSYNLFELVRAFNP